MRSSRLALKAVLLGTTLLAPGFAHAQEEPTAVEEVIVTGRRAADRAAIEDKRDADGQIDSVRADEVGKLPDQNVAEALRRLPGLAVANDQGEGRYLSVRGVSPDLLNVTLNGQTAAAPEPESRQVKLDDIPSALIGRVTVVKTLTPDLDANAIAGAANIETLTAYDRNRTFGTARVAYGYNDINGSNPYEFDASWGTVFGADRQFGVVFAINHSERQLAPDNLQAGGSWDEVNGFELPLEYSIRKYDTERRRSGAVLNLDWRPNDAVETYARILYSKYEDQELRNNFTVELDEDELSNQTDTTGDFAEADAIRALRTRQEDTSSFTSTLGARFEIGESELTIEGTYTKADKRDPRRDEWIFEAGDVTGSYDLGPELFRFFPDAAAFDSANFEFDETSYESRHAVEDLYQARIDYRMPLTFADETTLKFGAKILDRTKTNDIDATIYDGFAGPDLTLDMFEGATIPSIYEGRYPYGPTVDGRAADAFFRANQDLFEIDEEGTVGDSLAGDFEIQETIIAGYVMATIKTGQWTVVPGVRVEHTESEYAAKAVLDTYTLADLDRPYDVFGGQSYTDVFPGVNLRFDVNDHLVLRGAVTTAIGRPNYENLAPYTVVVTSDNEVEMGNPDLEPLRSVNFDIAAEYYLGNRGILSAAVFHKEISDPIYFTTTEETGVFAGQALVDAEVTRPVNAEEATVTGVEFNAQYELSFLPAPFDGLSVGGSLTFVESEASGIPGRPGETLPLANQSDQVASAQVTYEKHGLSARVAYTYRSAYLLEPGGDTDEDLYVDDFNQWDARIGYAFTSNASIFVEGSNLNNAANRFYLGRPGRVDENEIYGWSLRTGIQLSF